MSRIGNRKLIIPEGVTVDLLDGNILVKGPKGELTTKLAANIKMDVTDNVVTFTRTNEIKQTKANHGTMNSLVNNMMIGVKDGYKKDLEIVGVGYRFALKGDKLVISAGYSHPVEFQIPNGIKIDVPSNTEISVNGIDKILVGEIAAEIRKVREPEPYKAKGIRYKDEHIRRKEGKKAAK